MSADRKEVIGDATLYLGDCLELLRAGVFGRIGAIVSDPPYGIGYQHSGGGGGLARGVNGVSKVAPIHGDDVRFDPLPWLDAAPRSSLEKLNNGGTYGGFPLILLWGADHYMHSRPRGGTMLAWDKHLGRGADDSFADCEWAWCGRKVKRDVFRWLWKGITTDKTRLDLPGDGGRFRRVHVSQKPVELMRWCIDKVRPTVGLPVLDPYMGSASTGIAALSLGLPFIGCEIDPEHFEVACARMQMFVDGQQPPAMPLFDKAAHV